MCVPLEAICVFRWFNKPTNGPHGARIVGVVHTDLFVSMSGDDELEPWVGSTEFGIASHLDWSDKLLGLAG